MVSRGVGLSTVPELGWREKLEKDETYLVFVQTKDRFLLEGYHRGHIGLNHLAFQAGSKQQVDSLTKQLQDRGIEILYQNRHPFAGGEQHYAVFSKILIELKLNW